MIAQNGLYSYTIQQFMSTQTIHLLIMQFAQYTEVIFLLEYYN